MIKKIYINPGYTEQELNVKVSNYQKDYLLDNYECEVRMNSGDMDNISSINDANTWCANLFVTNCFITGTNGYKALICSEDRTRLGKIFEKRVKAIGKNSCGVMINPDIALLQDTTMPSILNEVAFIDDKKDILDLNDNELKKLGEAYAKATVEFLSLPRKKKVNVISKKENTKDEKSYTVRVDIDRLNIRKGPGKNYDITGNYTGRGMFVIVETSKGEGSDSGWGRLKSGAGWISLDFAERV